MGKPPFRQPEHQLVTFVLNLMLRWSRSSFTMVEVKFHRRLLTQPEDSHRRIGVLSEGLYHRGQNLKSRRKDRIVGVPYLPPRVPWFSEVFKGYRWTLRSRLDPFLPRQTVVE